MGADPEAVPLKSAVALDLGYGMDGASDGTVRAAPAHSSGLASKGWKLAGMAVLALASVVLVGVAVIALDPGAHAQLSQLREAAGMGQSFQGLLPGRHETNPSNTKSCMYPNGKQSKMAHFEGAHAYDGFTLLAFISCPRVFLVDNVGRLVHQWIHVPQAAKTVLLTDSGGLVTMPALPRAYPNADTSLFPKDLLMDCASGIDIWSWDDHQTFGCDLYRTGKHARCPHHDIEQLPNGNFLVPMWERREKAYCTQRGLDPNGLIMQAAGGDACWDDGILEVRTSGNKQCEVVWEWWMMDHIIQDNFPSKDFYGNPHEHPEKIHLNYVYDEYNVQPQVGHINTVSFNHNLNQIVFCSYAKSEMFIIDHTTTTREAQYGTGGRYGQGGHILYRYGNSPSYKHGITESSYSGPRQEQRIYGLHGAHWIPAGLKGSGQIILFNNGIMRNVNPGMQYSYSDPRSGLNSFSSVDTVQLPLQGDGHYRFDNDAGVYPPSEPHAHFDFSGKHLYAMSFGGAQRLPNGNTVMYFPGHPGMGQPFQVLEMDPDHRLVANFSDPWHGEGGMQIFKGFRYPRTHSAFQGKDVSPKDGGQN